MRFLYVLGWVLEVTGALATLSLGLVAAALQRDNIGDMAYVLFFASGIGALIMGLWSDSPPSPRLPREDRKRLAIERRRIMLDKEIARLEEENGMNE